MIGLAAFGGLLGLMALSAMWKGYVLTVLWAWFVVPVFGLPALALAPAIGLSLVVSFLTYQHGVAQDDTGDFSDRIAKSVVNAMLWPAMALGIGWVVRQIM